MLTPEGRFADVAERIFFASKGRVMNSKGFFNIAAAVVLLAAFPAGAHENEMEGGMTMPGSHDGTATADPQGFIRVSTPAGHEVVIGRKNPLTELKPEIVTEAGRASVKVFKLTVEDVKFEILPGKSVEGWGFNGLVPGPVIRVSEGDRVRIILTNNTAEDSEHTVHVHGQSKPLAADGVPFVSQNPVAKGETHTFEFTATNDDYEPHYIHTHSHKFLVVARDGASVKEPLEMDTVHVGPGQRVDILLTADNPGVWPLHCHNLLHVANDHVYPGGMLAVIRYVD
jgi:FtsP/CotA-like multicopper oxidase with cupredoxin domain